MLYNDVHHWLGWPDENQAFEPDGEGAKVYVEFARKKIVAAMKQLHAGVQVNVGVIAADPSSASSEAPLALVCEFPRGARPEELDLAHRLAWNFSRTALLITLEPHRLIAWSCYQDPSLGDKRSICTLETTTGLQPTGSSQQRAVRDLLHWVNLITNRAQTDLPKQFPPDGRADAMLLKNLRFVRRELMALGLSREFCHDLLARVIFSQFLFHRKDREGNAFFSDRMMKRLHEDGVLSTIHANLASVLSHKVDTYALFRWMDGKFNGDLFPGKETDNEKEREAAWKAERDAVSKDHLDLLAEMIRGNLVGASKQRTLWPYYSFDTIPLEFISSVYEEFLTEDERQTDKAFYTPSHLVDYVLDAVLPWNDDNWNVRILDPCCGSAIFLVKAFQRLIYRWRRANQREPLVSDLRPILENNLVGVDKNREAIRVACFSLYLAMADAIEPKHYITRDNVKVFPRLRGTRLIPCDFFEGNSENLRKVTEADCYDLILGNAPWGDGSILIDRLPNEPRAEYNRRIKANPTNAQAWAKKNGWPVANNDIGPVFLAKAAELLGRGGRVAMVNTAALLYRRDVQAAELRERFFTSYTFDEITNLSAIRREIFAEAIGPSCVVVFGKEKPQPQTVLSYFTPKPVRVARTSRGKQTTQGFTIEPHDVATITHAQAAETPWVWSALALGGNRHLMLVERLAAYPTLEKLEAVKAVETRKGVITGDGKQHFPKEADKPILAVPGFPKGVFLELDAATLPPWKDARATSGDSVDFSPFKSPQILIKQSYVAKLGRMRAAIVKKAPGFEETICREAYVTCHDLAPDGKHIRAACLAYNSQFAVFFFAMTSGSFPLYISKMSVKELLALPLPATAPDISTLDSFEAIDEATRKMFALTAADWDLIEDFLDYTLPDALRRTPGLARQPTQRKDKEGTKEPELSDYTKTFARVVKGTFGKTKAVAATIFTEPNTAKLPVRMLTIHLDAPDCNPLTIEAVEAEGLLKQLAEFHATHLKKKARDPGGSGLGFQRVAYFFQPSRRNGARVMNLTIVKPDERRYWTRSMAMRDADQLAEAIAKAAAGAARKA